MIYPFDPVNVPVLLQVTANSGHMGESARSEVDDAVASRLRFILAAACMSHDPVELGIRGWSLAAREEPGCLPFRVFGPDGEAATTFAVGADNEARSSSSSPLQVG